MGSQHSDRTGLRKPSDTPRSKNANVQRKAPAESRIEATESVAGELLDPLQKNIQAKVQEIDKARNNHSSSSQRRLIEADRFSLQNPWIQQSSSRYSKPQTSDPSQKLHKSISTASVDTVRRLLKKHAQQSRYLRGNPKHDKDQYVDPRSCNDYSYTQANSIPQDSATFFTPSDIVLHPQQKHPRLAIIIKPELPMSKGGRILRGVVDISVMESIAVIQESPLSIGCLSIDLLGVEYCGRQHHVFQSLAIDLIDLQHPPPTQFIASPTPSVDGYWELLPSTFSQPFELQLPKDPGPPPFRSRHGNIRYILSTTAIIRVGFREAFVRDSCEVCILTTHNPRTSLAKLPLPLNAIETLVVSRNMIYQDIILRASLTRDVWASGMSVFVDIHVHNRSLKVINKVTLSLERVMMVYHHSIAQLDQGLYRQSRLPDKIYRKTVVRKAITRSETGWRGILPHSKESRTWMLCLPTGLATISTGRYFGVRYFLNVSLHLAHGMKTLRAKLPVTILDPNSLDITSNLAVRLSKEQHRRSSLFNSESRSASVTRRTAGKRSEQKTPVQDQSLRQRRETWAWASEVSPRSSLMPSPLLPSYPASIRTGKTASRLRTRSTVSTPPVPHIPDSLRPLLEAEQDPRSINRLYQIVSPDKSRKISQAMHPVAISSQDPVMIRPIGTSAQATFQERLQGRSRKAFIGAGLSGPPLVEQDGEDSWVDDCKSSNIPVSSKTGMQSQPGIEEVDLKDLGSVNRFKKSPFKKRKAVHHRRAISRSKDVRSIYRLNGSSKENTTNKKSDSEPDNGWETVENFF